METLDLIGLYAWAFFGAVVPALALILYVYWYDRKHPEPALQLLKGFVYGILSIGLLNLLWLGIPAYFDWAKGGGSNVLGRVQHAFFSAALPEEFVKLVMLWLLLKWNRHFDERLDGIIYAVCVGMGFATLENIQYVFNSGSQWGNVVALRAVLAVPGHYIFAVAMGYFYSMAKFSPANGIKRFWQLALILLIPVLLHGIYDSIVMTMGLDAVGTVVYIVLVLALFVFCYSFHKYCNQLIEKHLAADKELFDLANQEQMRKKRQEEEQKRQEEKAAKEAEAAMSDFDKSRMLQQAIIESRTNYYISDEDATKQLDDFLNHPEWPVMIITGQSGSGKSALLANWFKQHQDDERQNIICHFIGNGCILSDYRDVAYQLCLEIQYYYSLPAFENEEKIDPIPLLEDCLTKVQGRHPLVILLDGIDRVFGAEEQDLFTWLPEPNQHIRYVFSTNQDNDAIEIFRNRGYHIVEVAPLNENARSLLVEHYTENGPQLSDEQKTRIINDPESANPLVLKTLLQELFRSEPQQLDQDIDYFLKPCSISDYFQRLLERQEDLMGGFFTQHMLSILAAGASGGLTMKEITEAYRMTNDLQWDDLINNFGIYLIKYKDRYTLFHQLMLEAVSSRYSQFLPSAHNRLVKVLSEQ